MTTEKKAVDRRSFMKGAIATVAVIPFSGALAACAGNGSEPAAKKAAGGKASAKNPFGMADKSSVDAVIFDGGYGTDYVAFAASLMEKNHAGSTVKVSPTTKIATELQPRFVGGNPPDLIDNSGANAIGFSTIFDPVVELFAGEHTHLTFWATSGEDMFLITAQGMDFTDPNWSFHLEAPDGTRSPLPFEWSGARDGEYVADALLGGAGVYAVHARAILAA